VKSSDGSIKYPGLDNHAMGTIFEELVRRFNVSWRAALALPRPVTVETEKIRHCWGKNFWSEGSYQKIRAGLRFMSPPCYLPNDNGDR
jgi:hypothetical protein